MAFRGSHSVRDIAASEFEGGAAEAAALRQEYLLRWREVDGRMPPAEVDDFVRRLAALAVCSGINLDHELRAWKATRDATTEDKAADTTFARLQSRLTRKIG